MKFPNPFRKGNKLPKTIGNEDADSSLQDHKRLDSQIRSLKAGVEEYS